jgi:RNA polymerase sigma factor (sigma-70 family)
MRPAHGKNQIICGANIFIFSPPFPVSPFPIFIRAIHVNFPPPPFFSFSTDQTRPSYVSIFKSMEDSAVLKKQIETAYRDHRDGFVTRAKRATRNILDAEDAVHEAFVSALSRIDVIGRVENLPGWLFTVVRNRIIDLWRGRRRHAAAGETDVGEETIVEVIASTGLDPADETVRAELADALTDAIAALPAEQREVIEAQVMENLTFREIAGRTGESINTLTTRKKLAVKKLSAALRGWITE